MSIVAQHEGKEGCEPEQSLSSARWHWTRARLEWRHDISTPHSCGDHALAIAVCQSPGGRHDQALFRLRDPKLGARAAYRQAQDTG